MEILITGDYCPQERVKEVLEKDPSEFIDEQILSLFKRQSYVIVNLECPIKPKNGKSINKQGPVLSCSDNAVRFLKDIGCTCVTLANNHINDYGPEGIKETIQKLKDYQIDYVGVGLTIDEASKILKKQIDNKSIAFINICEHEFSIATDKKPGSNPIDVVKQYYVIKEARQNYDYVIVIVHGGVEHFQYPTKRMIQTYRFFIDSGADAVINHHQHCPCGFEYYKGKPIYYGLGNFIFDWKGKRNSIWNIGYMVKLHLEGNHAVSSEIIPYRQCDETPTINLIHGKDLEDFNQKISELSTVIFDSYLLEYKFKEFNLNNDYLYRKMLEPYSGRAMNGFYRRGWLPSCMSKERIIALKDFVMCESHYDRFKEYIERTYQYYFNE